jgi:hypothetical protein
LRAIASRTLINLIVVVTVGTVIGIIAPAVKSVPLSGRDSGHNGLSPNDFFRIDSRMQYGSKSRERGGVHSTQKTAALAISETCALGCLLVYIYTTHSKPIQAPGIAAFSRGVVPSTLALSLERRRFSAHLRRKKSAP